MRNDFVWVFRKISAWEWGSGLSITWSQSRKKFWMLLAWNSLTLGKNHFKNTLMWIRGYQNTLENNSIADDSSVACSWSHWVGAEKKIQDALLSKFPFSWNSFRNVCVKSFVSTGTDVILFGSKFLFFLIVNSYHDFCVQVVFLNKMYVSHQHYFYFFCHGQAWRSLYMLLHL